MRIDVYKLVILKEKLDDAMLIDKYKVICCFKSIPWNILCNDDILFIIILVQGGCIDGRTEK